MAAARISDESVLRARGAIRARALEFLRVLGEVEQSLLRFPAGTNRLARALALLELAYLPLRPEMCPFCIEYADNRCSECGYAETHGGICSNDNSRFVQLSDAIIDLGMSIKFAEQDDIAEDDLRSSISSARRATDALLSDLDELDAAGLMRAKARYIKDILCALPVRGSLDPLRQNCIMRAELYW
ncbi:MAG: hypothetical protein NQU42_07400 [Methanothrix sp.]|uniref:hypothetical protein n=1 Tax=Methanothrix sp. TaxID=90426 RepID=UPI0025FB96AF|nr:hypothetical protein [Methanothrix sp.]MCQ8903899.1 hypothetical protein [Methanothrix sp.]